MKEFKRLGHVARGSDLRAVGGRGSASELLDNVPHLCPLVLAGNSLESCLR